MKKSLTLILILIIVLVLVIPIFPVRAGGTRESGSAPGMESIYTDYDGVYLTVKSIDADDGGHKVFNIVWHNDTSQTITYGAKYSIEFKDGVEWKDVSQEDIIFLAIGYLLKPHSTTIESYTTQRFDISKNGIYRLRSDFSNGDGKQYCTWIEFEVRTNMSNVDKSKIPVYRGVFATNMIIENGPAYYGGEGETLLGKIHWLLCPACNCKTRIKILDDTVLEKFPLYCPKCRLETLINVRQLHTSIIKGPDA